MLRLELDERGRPQPVTEAVRKGDGRREQCAVRVEHEHVPGLRRRGTGHAAHGDRQGTRRARPERHVAHFSKNVGGKISENIRAAAPSAPGSLPIEGRIVAAPEAAVPSGLFPNGPRGAQQSDRRSRATVELEEQPEIAGCFGLRSGRTAAQATTLRAGAACRETGLQERVEKARPDVQAVEDVQAEAGRQLDAHFGTAAAVAVRIEAG